MKNDTFKKLFSSYPYLIVALILLLCLTVYPLQLFGHTDYESSSLETGIFPNLNLADGAIATGEFIPSHERLTAISFQFLISGKARDGSVTLELYDKQQKKLTSCTLESGDIMNYRWIDFPIDLTLDMEQTYSWHLRAYDYEDASLALYSGSPDIGPEESGDFYYNGLQEEKLTPAIIYTYTGPIDEAHALPYYIVFLLFGLLLYAALHKFEKTNEDV